MTFIETLPPNCPPDEAEEIETRIEVYRLVETDPPTSQDFLSQRAKQPRRKFNNECIARGLSVFYDQNKCEEKRKLPALRNHIVCKIILESGAGCILDKTRSPHKTWWPYNRYDILNQCEVCES